MARRLCRRPRGIDRSSQQDAIAERYLGLDRRAGGSPCGVDGRPGVVGDGAAIFAGRAKIVAERLAQIQGVDFTPPDGAFYAFIGIQRLLGKQTAAGEVLADDSAFAAHLLNGFGLSSVPGAAFGAPGFIRFSIAASDRELDAACDRLGAMVQSLKG